MRGYWDRYTPNEDRKTNVEFAYIPEWDSWPGVLMKGVSELTEDEADEAFVSPNDWKKCCARQRKEPYTA